MTGIVDCRHDKFSSMKFLSESGVGVPVNAKEEDKLWNLSDVTYKSEEAGDLAQTHVIWVQNPWSQFDNSDKNEGMPAATLGSSQHPNNEECGIRDVWAHNLEDEFRTIRQVRLHSI